MDFHTQTHRHTARRHAKIESLHNIWIEYGFMVYVCAYISSHLKFLSNSDERLTDAPGQAWVSFRHTNTHVAQTVLLIDLSPACPAIRHPPPSQRRYIYRIQIQYWHHIPRAWMCYLCTTVRATSVCARLHPPAPPARCDKQPALQSNGSAHQCDWKILVHVHAVTSFQEHTACVYVHACKWEYYALAITGGFMMRVRVYHTCFVCLVRYLRITIGFITQRLVALSLFLGWRVLASCISAISVIL